MSNIDRIVAPRRHKMAVCQDANLPARGVLSSRPENFFSDRYTLSVEYEAADDGVLGDVEQRRSHAYASTIILMVAIGIPLLIFAVLALIN